MSDSELKITLVNAAACLNQGNYPAARSLYEKACLLEPSDANLWLMLGNIDAETGRHAEAIDSFEKALYHDPELAEAHLRLAQIALKEQRFSQSHELLGKAVSINPDYAEAWITRGLLLAEEGANADAEHSFNRAARSANNPARTWSGIASKLRSQGSIRLAIDAYHKALEHSPGNPGLWSALGECFRESGDNRKAINAYTHALSLDNSNRSALFRLAELHLESGQFSAAIKICKDILVLKPDAAEAYGIMGTAYQIQGNLLEARESLQQATMISPDNEILCYKYGCILHVLGELDDALLYFMKAMRSGNPLPEAIGGVARIHMQKGNYSAVEQLLEPLINAGTRNPQVLPTLAAIAPRFNLEKQVIQLLGTASSSTNLDNSLRSRLYHSLATLYENEGNHEAAFGSHRKSKELVPARYDSASNTRYTNRIINCFSCDFMKNTARSTNRSDLPVFIVGMPRSGTTLVEQIIASHRRISGAGELPYINRIVRSLEKDTSGNTTYPECIKGLNSAMLDAAATSYIRELGQLSPDAARVTDKMPHNFRYLGLIELLFPEAHVIHVYRDPLDTCLSCYFHEFSAAHAYTRNLGDLGRHYNDYRRLMNHWNTILQLPVLNIEYEELVNNPEQKSRQIIKFCGLEWDDNCLSPHENNRIVSTLSAEQVRKPIYSSSINRWRLYENHLDELKDVLGYQSD